MKLDELLLAAAKSPTVAWRIAVILALGSHIAWDYGLIPFVDSAHASERELARTTTKLDRLLEIGLVEEIEKILRYKCMNPADTTFDRTLIGLEAEYRELIGVPYRRPDCVFLTLTN